MTPPQMSDMESVAHELDYIGKQLYEMRRRRRSPINRIFLSPTLPLQFGIGIDLYDNIGFSPKLTYIKKKKPVFRTAEEWKTRSETLKEVRRDLGKLDILYSEWEKVRDELDDKIKESVKT